MTLEKIGRLLVTVDPDVRRYFSQSENRAAYTYWEETQRLSLISNDVHAEAWRFYVHRYTKIENDEVAARLFRTLDQHPAITVRYTVSVEPDTGYIHHVYECEAY